MTTFDWLIVVLYLIYIVYDGVRRSGAGDQIRGYFLANRMLPWWAVGLSVMATQMSAITLVGTTGQAFAGGMSFIQFYFGLPLAMVILCITLVPFFYRANVFTAYEILEKRFDARTRSLTSFFFLLSRGLACGVIIAAPAVILSIVLGWNLQATVLAIGVPTVVYTMLGGVQAVTWTDVKQMVLIFAGIFVCLVVIVQGFPEGVSISDALTLAGATGHLKTVDFTFNLDQTYTFWSGLLGGTFLMLSYFGCDQSQVQRFLTARSVDEGRISLLMSAFIKIPLQFLILLIGVLVFVFYQFTTPPMIFNPVAEQQMENGSLGSEYGRLREEYDSNLARLRESALHLSEDSTQDLTHREYLVAFNENQRLRAEALELVRRERGDLSFSDVNYVFPSFIINQMPIGAVGLMIAAIFAAAMSSISAELNALSTTSVIDFYRRHFRPEAEDAHYLRVSKLATALWGLFACVVAMFAPHLGSLIEVVNRFGSFFYGSLLGVFALAFLTTSCTARGAFYGLLAGMAAVAAVSLTTSISFLWYNVVGVVTVFSVGMLISLFGDRGTPGVHFDRASG